jgi:cytochrome c biogenesis protein
LSDTLPTRRSTGIILLEFLGSMNLAITLLGMLAIASTVGTVLQQNQQYQDYIIKFGPFWFEVYKALGLYDVYSAAWFLLILTFLVVSTSVCIYRNAPGMLREMKNFREDITGKSLRGFHNTAEWSSAQSAESALAATAEHLSSYGYRIRRKDYPGYTVLAAMKGAANRVGYLLAHIGIVVICVGGLLDGNMPLKLAELAGKIRPETRTLLESEWPDVSRLPVDNSSFRGRMNLPEGVSLNYLEVRLRDGFLLQKLPFHIGLEDFRIEHYPSGQPKNFESDLVIYDPAEPKPLRQTISVNHPWTYKGYSMYQADFGDGGSTLRIRAWPLGDVSASPVDTKIIVGKSVSLSTPQGPINLEVSDFKRYNVNPAPPGSGKQFRDLGPTFTFKLRNAEGVALEYENYMAPVEQQGRWFFITGVRSNPNDAYRYVHIPIDSEGGIDRFMRFRNMLQDDKTLQQAASQVVAEALPMSGPDADEKINALTGVVRTLLSQFSAGGFDGANDYIEAISPPTRREQAANTYTALLVQALAKVYAGLIAQQGAEKAALDVTEVRDRQYFSDAIEALGGIALQGSPYYLQLLSFDQVESSLLQITRAPGKNVVYAGFGLLITGVFMMFYLPQRRLWAWLKQNPAGARIVFAGSSHRDQISFIREFTTIRQGLEARLKMP